MKPYGARGWDARKANGVREKRDGLREISATTPAATDCPVECRCWECEADADADEIAAWDVACWDHTAPGHWSIVWRSH